MAIAFTTGTTNTGASVTSLTTNFSPTTGNIVVVAVGINPSSITNLAVADSNSVALTAGPAITNGGNSFVGLFYYTVPASAPTNFRATWTGSANITMLIAQYSGAAGGVGAVGATNSGALQAQSVSLTTTGANSFIVGAINTIATTSTLVTGNVRENISIGNPRVKLIDNTVVSSGSSVSIATSTGSNANWTAAAVELLLVVPAATGFSNSLMMVGCGR